MCGTGVILSDLDVGHGAHLQLQEIPQFSADEITAVALRVAYVRSTVACFIESDVPSVAIEMAFQAPIYDGSPDWARNPTATRFWYIR
jgi:hypothetical protein